MPGSSDPTEGGLLLGSARQVETEAGSPFVVASSAVVAHLSGQAPLDLWLLTCVTGADQIVLASAGGLSQRPAAGSAVSWLESLDLHMAAGRAPSVAPRVADVPLYAAAAAGRWAWVRAYIGIPLVRADGDLVGTLSGFSRRPEDPHLVRAAPTVALCGQLLSALLTSQHEAARGRDELAAAREVAETDALTGLRNRHGWRDNLAHETQRCARYGVSAGVIVLDLDDFKTVNDTRGHAAGDSQLRRVAEVLTHTCRPSDVIARPGGDEFAVLAVEADGAALHSLTSRIRTSLHDAGVAASTAGTTHIAGEDLSTTWTRADTAMYAEKRRRRALRLTRPAPADPSHVAAIGPIKGLPAPDRSVD